MDHLLSVMIGNPTIMNMHYGFDGVAGTTNQINDGQSSG